MVIERHFIFATVVAKKPKARFTSHRVLFESPKKNRDTEGELK